MKKNLSFILIIVLLVNFSFADNFKHPSEVWELFKIEKNLDINNHQEFINLEKKIIDLYESLDMRLEVSSVLCPRYKKVAIAYSKLNDFENAALYMSKHLELTEFRMDNYQVDETDNLIDAKRLLNSYDVKPMVFAFSEDENNIPFYNEQLEPESGLYFGRTIRKNSNIKYSDMENESLVLLYVEFLQENIKDYNKWLNKYKDSSKIVQIAWNFPEEMKTCEKINDNLADKYIFDNLKYINDLDMPIILRIGAEQNCWANTNPEIYKEAYIKIAKEARKLAPEVALVFSLNSIGDRRYNYSDFYPGDEYVDWVGVSLYTHKYYKGENDSELEQMTYGVGEYSNPINLIKPIVKEFGDNKPIIITEGAVSYSINNVRTKEYDEFAINSMRNYFKALPMIYPQVKAVAYFDNNVTGSKHEYALDNFNELEKEFNDITYEMPNYIQYGNVKAGSYIDIEKFDENVKDAIKIGSYIDYIKLPNTEVSYILNDNLISKDNISPSCLAIDVSSINEGENKLKILFENKNGYSKVLEYNLIKQDDRINFIINK